MEKKLELDLVDDLALHWVAKFTSGKIVKAESWRHKCGTAVAQVAANNIGGLFEEECTSVRPAGTQALMVLVVWAGGHTVDD